MESLKPQKHTWNLNEWSTKKIFKNHLSIFFSLKFDPKPILVNEKKTTTKTNLLSPHPQNEYLNCDKPKQKSGMLNKTPNKQIYRMLSLLLNCLKVHVFVCLPLFNHRFCSIEILLLSKSETKTTTESFLICSYSSPSTIFLFVSNSQLIQFIINVIESMYYVIKLEIGTTKRIDRQHKRYVSFPILTHTKLKANPKQTQKKIHQQFHCV